MKERIKRLIEEGINQQLTHGQWNLHLPVVDWRDIAAQSAPAGGRTNDLFVREARNSSVTIVLLFDRVPAGTEEELLAVVNDDDVELKVFWIRRPRRFESWRRPTEVRRLLERHSDDFKYLELSDPDSDTAWIAITSNLVSVLLKALRGQKRRPHVEARPEL